MNIPINERFTSVQKDDLKAALGKVAADGEPRELATLVEDALRDELLSVDEDDQPLYGLTHEQVRTIVDTATEAILDYGPGTSDYSTDEAVQAVEDFLCI